MGRSRLALTVLIVATVLCATSCRREARVFRPEPPNSEALQFVRVSDLQPGIVPAESTGQTVIVSGPVKNEFEDNAYALSEGKRLFSSFNCVGCHAHGGGGMGPALMDDKWLYGNRPEQVFKTIVEGRPNGMPTFGGKIASYQIWQLAAYVRSLSGEANVNAAPGRDDDMKIAPPENSRSKDKPADALQATPQEKS